MNERELGRDRVGSLTDLTSALRWTNVLTPRYTR